MGVTVAMGVIKLGCAFAGDWARRVVPRAALLGSIAGVAILLIAFLPVAAHLRRSPRGRGLADRAPRRAAGRRADAVGAARRARRGAGGDRHLLGPLGARRRRRDAGAASRDHARRPRPGPAAADARLARRARRHAAVPAARGALRAGHRGRRHRQHRVGHRGGRRVPHARHPADRGGRDDRGRLLRGRDPEHAVHRPSRVQGDGRAGRLHAGHRPPDRRRRGGGRRRGAGAAPARRRRSRRSWSSWGSRSPRRPSWPRRRVTPPRSRCRSCPRWPRSS